MIYVEDRPTVAERYSTAIQSSNLSVKADKRGDVDWMIAAGWVPDGLAVRLYRLAVEFDSVRGEVRGVGALNTTERVLVLSRLKSLRLARDALGEFAIELATKKRFMHNDEAVLKLAGRVLDVFLDPTCHACEGRSFTGGGAGEQAGPKILCRACRATGQRRQHLGRDEDEIGFARDLLAHMEQERQKVDARIAIYMR